MLSRMPPNSEAGITRRITFSASLVMCLIAAAASYVAVDVWVARSTLHPQSWALAFTLPLLYSPHVHAQSLVLLIAAAALYLADSQSSERPIVDIRYVLVGLIAITVLWWLSLFGLGLIAFVVLAAYWLFSHRWPQPAPEPARSAGDVTASADGQSHSSAVASTPWRRHGMPWIPATSAVSSS